MCAPLAPQDGHDAVVYVERHDPARPFTTAELGPFAAMAVGAGPALASEIAWFRWRATAGAGEDSDAAPVLVGESPAFLAMLDVAEHVAAARASVLVRGEPGTGRRLLARLLHDRSRGHRRPFVVVGCASLPPGDEAAALFGEASGGRRRPGILEDVGFGTLCLADVQDLPRGVQAKLAESLAALRYVPEGASEPRMLRCRVVATASRNLDPLAASGEFHGPLAAALSGVTVGVPPLAEREGDAVLLLEHFAALHGRRRRGRACTVTARAKSAIAVRTFPRNVAELSNLVERAVLTAATDELDAADLDGTPSAAAGPRTDDLSLEAAERAAIVRALEAARGRKGRAAELLGISWPTLTRKIREYGIGAG